MATKKERRELGRRSLAFFLSLIMVISGAQITAFGATFKDQTMDGSYTVDESGNATFTDATSVTEDGFTLTKSINQTGENAFDITLNVVTSQKVVTNDAAVAIVIDNSSSMENGAGGGSKKNRLEAIQEILTEEGGFLDSLAAANSGKVYVSVVKFDANAHKVTDWLDITNATNLNSVKTAVNGITNGNGTNIHGGLMLGRNRLAMDELEDVGAKYLVLLSDGEPHHNSSESSSTERINGSMGYGNNPKNYAQNVAKDIRDAGTTIYTVGYGYSDDVLENIAGSEERTFSGNDSEAISEAFADIAQATTEGMSGAGTKVHDPMGQYIVMGDIAGLTSDNVAANGNGLVWSLDPSKAADVDVDTTTGITTYTYEITYPITLDTAAAGFEENNPDGSTKYYPSNGYTYLSVPQASGGEKKIAFLVPGVCGWIPEYSWTLEYYLQDESSLGGTPSYTLDKSEEKGLAKLHSTVNAPEGYEEEYAEEDYTYAGGNPSMIIRTSDNVMKLYYNIISAKVTENHFYKTDKILADGTEVIASYAAIADKSYEKDVKINTEYSAEPELEYGNAMYELDYTNPAEGKITVSQEASNNIDLFYKRLIDERATTSAIVKHIYTTYAYELNEDGQYELVEKGSNEEIAAQATDLKATTMFDVSSMPLAGYEDFELNKSLGDYADMLQGDGTLSFKVAEDPEENVRTLYFDKIEDNREKIDIVVNHYYTKTIYTYENGEEVVTYDPDNIKGYSESDVAYKGETYTAFEINSYKGEMYESDAGNADKLVVPDAQGDLVIDLYYNLEEYPEKTELIVNHTWRTYTEVTIEETEEYFDEATSSMAIRVIGTRTEIRESIDHEIDGSENPIELFEGEKYIATAESWGEGYTLNEEESDEYGIGGVDTQLNLYYDKSGNADLRADASIDVQHKYYTNMTVIDGEGNTAVIRVPDGSALEEYDHKKAGDSFTAVAAPSYNDNEYSQITAEEDLGPVILQPGTNATMVIEYERDVDARIATEYLVNYEYRTYDMIIGEDGKAAYGEPTVEIVTGTAISAYVGQKVTLDAGNRAGFSPLATNPATQHVLTASGNEWTFVHERYNALDRVNVEVNHHYETITIAANGTSSASVSDVDGIRETVYMGEAFAADAVPNGFTQNGLKIDGIDAAAEPRVELNINKNTVIDFYYTKTIDNSVTVPYTIKHVYNFYDYDGSLINSSTGDPITSGTGFLGTPITATPEPNSYTLVDVDYNGTELDITKAEHTVILEEGANDITFTYELYKERDKVDVKVVHNYYKNEEAISNGEEALEVYELTETGLYEDSEYAAEMLEKEGFVFFSADPEEMKIVVKEGEDNKIIVNYVKKEAGYQVVHVYNKNGTEEGRTSERFIAYHGDVIEGEDITRVPSNDGKNYTFVSISDDIVLDAEEEKVITLVYNRTVSGPKPPRKPDPTPEPTEPIVPEEPEEPIEIPEEEVPLASQPDDSEDTFVILEDEVPLANVPKTGDNLALYYAFAISSALGLVILALTGKKRKEEEV